jgi:hypothetical protein
LKIYVLTSDKADWLIPGFLHQWYKYIDAPITVAGYTRPSSMPKTKEFVSIGKYEDYPLNKWSDGLIKLLEKTRDKSVMLLLEDFWLTRKPNLKILRWAEHFMDNTKEKDIPRFCLTTDRLYAGHMKDMGSVSDFDLIASNDSPYDFSYQASIWNRRLLLSLLKPGQSPWLSEVDGDRRFHERKMICVGTRQWPLRYAQVVNKGVFDRTGGEFMPLRTLSNPDWEELDALGYTNPPQI